MRHSQGSAESLTEAAGGDGTDIFIDIGHSSFATSLADMFILWGAGKKKKPDQEKQVRAPYAQRMYTQMRPTRFQVKMKRDRYFAERLILRDNLIVRGPCVTCGTCGVSEGCTAPSYENDSLSDSIGNSVGHNIDDNGLENPNERGIEGEVAGAQHSPREISAVTITSAAGDQSTSVTITGNWPLGVSLNFSLGLDQIALPKSVFSLAESVFLANAKATNSLKRGIGTRLRDSTGIKSMVPGLCDKHGQCDRGCKHKGRLRMVYDPLAMQWWGWWTCCGMGELAVDAREEQALCAQREVCARDQIVNSFNKIC